MQNKATTGLFRFTTFRAPQLVDTDRKKLGFIQHPNLIPSHFLDGITASTTIEDARAIITAAASTYPSADVFRSVAQLKSYNPVLWEFSSRLMKSRSTLTFATDLEPPLDLLLPGAAPTVAAMKERLWDNLYYDLVLRVNRPVREVCLQMIVAINYLAQLDDSIASDIKVPQFVIYPKKPKGVPLEEKRALLLQRLANAAVVIHPAFTRYKEQDYSKLKAATEPTTFRKKKYRTQQVRHSAEIAKLQYDGLDVIRTELIAFGEQYDKDRQAALSATSATYQTTITGIQNTWLAGNATLSDALKKENERDAEFDILDHVPVILFPPFAFKFNEPFSTAYSSGKLSAALDAWIDTNSLRRATVEQATKEMNVQCRKSRKEAAQVFRPGMTRGILNGVPFQNSSAELYDYTFNIATLPARLKAGDPAKMVEGFYLSLILDRDDVSIDKADLTLTVNGGTSLSDSKPKLLGNKNGRLFISAFGKDTLNVALNDEIAFEAEIALDNGVQLRVKRRGTYIGNAFSGTAELVRGWDAEEPIHYGISSMGVADHRLVEQEVCCYIPGEVSHIENVMAREYREKSSRSLVRTEGTTVRTETKEVEMIEDNVSTTRNEMSTEVANVIQSDRSSDMGFNAHVEGKSPSGLYAWGGGMQADFGFSRSTSDSNSVARLYAEDVTRRALERITQSVTVTRTSTIIREYEENNKHGFDNRGGGENVTGVYRWVDKVYTNRLINYGKRLLYEFMVPEPSRFYKLAIVVEAAENNGHGTGTGGTGQPALQTPPVSPESEGITGFDDINEDNYVSIAALYGVTNLEPPKAATATTEKTIGGGEVGGNSQTENHALMLPPDYRMIQLTYAGHGDKRANGHIKVSAAGLYYEKTSGHGYFEINASMSYPSGPEGSIDIIVNLRKLRNWSVLVRANCALKTEVYQAWQLATYTAIMDAYNAQLQAYNDAAAAAAAAAEVAAAAQEVEAEGGRNPQFNDQIVHTELKRLCIEMLMTPFGYQQGARDFYRDGQCGVPILPSNRELGDYKILIDFFEQAFDWHIMAQVFYPYYWAQRCRWKELFQSTDSKDQGFQAFLQSGMAKVVVPIKPGYEAAVGFYMETGDIWTGTRMVIHTDDETYLSLVDEMNAVEGFVEREWETTVPTTLTIIQKDSALLNVGGLPCCQTDDEPPIEQLLQVGTIRLTRPEDEEVVP